MSDRKTVRLQRENARLQKEIAKEGGSEAHLQAQRWVVETVGDDVLLWSATMIGAEGTPYDGQTYKLQLDFRGVDYPTRPPKVNFVGKIPFHANVYRSGDICIDILGNQWSPIMKIRQIITSLVSLLNEPNTSSPANSEASRAYDADTEPNKPTFCKLVAAHYAGRKK